jgi:Tol biopolymer transport system component
MPYRFLTSRAAYRVLFIAVALSIICIPVFAAQTRVTQHTLYMSCAGSGSGKVYFVKDQTGETPDLWSMNENGTGVQRVTNDALYEKSLSFAPDGTKIIVVKESDSTDYIYKMNPDGSSPSELYSTAGSISGAAVSPDGSKIAFIENMPGDQGGTLLVMDNTGSGLHTLSVNSIPPKARALCSGIRAATRSSFAVAGTTMTKNSVYGGISFSPDSSKILFDGDRTINVNGTGLVTISTMSFDSGSCWMKSNRIVGMTYDYDTGNYALGTINPNGTRYSLLFTADYISSFAVSPDESKIACCAESWSGSQQTFLVILSTSGAMLLNKQALCYGTVSWSSNSKVCYTGILDNVYGLGLSGTVTSLTNNSQNDLNYLYDARAGKIAYMGAASVYTANSDGSNRAAVLQYASSTPASVDGILLSPDGTKILYSVYGLGDMVYTRNSNGTGNPVLIDMNTSGYTTDMRWNSTGTRIMYRGDSGYVICRPDGTNKVSVGNNNYPCLFSTDGTKVIYESTQGMGQYNVYTASANMASPRQIASDYLLLDCQSNKVLIQGLMNDNMFVINDDGTGLQAVNQQSTGIASLSPDGTKIAFMGDHSLNVVDSNGANLQKLCDHGDSYGEHECSWSPDSRHLAFSYLTRVGGPSRIYIYNPANHSKYDLNQSLNSSADNYVSVYMTGNNTISYWADFDIWTGDLSAAVITPPNSPDNKVISYPNPFSIAAGGNITITGTHISNGEVRICTLSGKLVKIIKEISGSDSVTWNRTNFIGNPTVSGLYIVSTANSSGKATGKIAVIR